MRQFFIKISYYIYKFELLQNGVLKKTIPFKGDAPNLHIKKKIKSFPRKTKDVLKKIYLVAS